MIFMRVAGMGLLLEGGSLCVFRNDREKQRRARRAKIFAETKTKLTIQKYVQSLMIDFPLFSTLCACSFRPLSSFFIFLL